MKTPLSVILKRLSAKVEQNPLLGFGDRLASLRQEHAFLLEYMKRGYEDEKRESLYSDMCKKAYCLESDIDIAVTVAADSYLNSISQGLRNTDVSTSSLIESLGGQSSLGEHFASLQLVFNAILLSPNWKEQDSRLWLSFLLSDGIEENDACTIVSAIMLSAYRRFSFEKFKTLFYVYMMTDSEKVRQRALVGWVMCYSEKTEFYEDDMSALLSQLADDDGRLTGDLLELLMQIVSCRNAERDSQKMEKEIIPQLSKHNGIKISQGKIVMDEETSVDDIINPGDSERNMEEMEASINKLLEMQKQGVDLYFKGFSHMKRYPFFYKLVNWFVPFTISHPDIKDACAKIDSLKFVNRVFDDGPFCDSDKYSFVFAMTHVIDQLPENVRKMMEEGSVVPAGALGADNSKQSSTYIRRLYLQDLYRFFMLFPQYHFYSVFEDDMLAKAERLLAALSGGNTDSLCEYASYLYRHGESRRLPALFEILDEKSPKCMLLKAAYSQDMHEFATALSLYKKVLEQEPDNTKAMVGVAKMAFYLGEYELSSAYFDRLRTIKPDNISYSLNYVMSEANAGRTKEVINEAYRLDFVHPDNVAVKRVIGWLLLMDGRFEQASAVLGAIAEGQYGKESATDFLNAGYARWFANEIEQALTMFRRFSAQSETPLAEAFDADKSLLFRCGMTEFSIAMLLDACEN